MREVDYTNLERIVLHETMWNLGIIPIESPDVDVSKVLKQLPKDEARKVSRKFRKLWRKIQKRKVGAREAVRRTGLKSAHPSRIQKRDRKALVVNEIMRNIVEPTIANFVDNNNGDENVT